MKNKTSQYYTIFFNYANVLLFRLILNYAYMVHIRNLLFMFVVKIDTMKKNGYYGIGILNPKTSENFGTLYRTAQILNADFIFIIGTRFKVQTSDTMNSSKHIPLFEYKDFKDFNNHRPYSCKLIGIEITDTATKLHEFKHPKQGCYLLGSEDNGLTKEAIDNCQEIIYLEGERSMNVAVAGSIVLYDRHIKFKF